MASADLLGSLFFPVGTYPAKIISLWDHPQCKVLWDMWPNQKHIFLSALLCVFLQKQLKAIRVPNLQ